MIDPKAVAIVGFGAIMPDAADGPTFWKNIQQARYSITDVPLARWNPADYFNPDPSVPDKTYSKIGGWVKHYEFEPLKWGFPIPPKVIAVMDEGQRWAIAAARQALLEYGYPKRPLDGTRTAVILGNALAGENHYRTTLRIHLPDYLNILAQIPDFQNLPPSVQESLVQGMTKGIRGLAPDITEDTMPGELGNIIAGRVANVFNFSGPNFVTDAACASSFAALNAAVEGLVSHQFDAVLTGGVDRNMGPEGFVKFCKIGALSAEGSRPYSDRANGFVMGEGAAIFLLKRLVDAERDGDTIYAVIRGIGGSSDGKGKGITAPNPAGQQKAVERAWKDAGVDPATVQLIEGHGTSTKVGDVVEVNTLATVFGELDIPLGSVALGSVKSNIGHLKSAAGAAGMLKVMYALHDKILPPSANFERPNPNIDFAHLPFKVNTEARPWPQPKNGVPRRAGVSAFGFGGTNFHVVMEEYLPGMLTKESAVFPGAEVKGAAAAVATPSFSTQAAAPASVPATPVPSPVMTASDEEIKNKILALVSEQTGYPADMLDLDLDLEADLGIDTVKQAELFAAVRGLFGIPRREDLRLSDYNTLKKVIGFVKDAGAGSTAAAIPAATAPVSPAPAAAPKAVEPGSPLPPRPLLFLSANTADELKQKLSAAIEQARQGTVPPTRTPSRAELVLPERLAMDYENAEDLVKKGEKTLKGFENDTPASWQVLTGQGVYRGHGEPGKLAFMFPGQGSQYANMLRELRDLSPVVAETFREADEVMTPILGRSLTSLIFVDGDKEALAKAEEALRDTTITQPAVLTASVAMTRLMATYGYQPDMVIGHSLGEYAALVSAGVLSFPEALKVVSARGREMVKVSMDDNGCMAAVPAPIAEVEKALKEIDGYVVIANVNSPMQSVIGGATQAVEEAVAKFQAAGYQATKIPVSHAFHTRIVAPASGPLRNVIAGMNIQTPRIPIVANVTAEVYPTSREEILDLLAAQVASPVQFIKSMRTLYGLGARVLVECGPKRVLTAVATDNLKEKDDITVLGTNHPRKGALPSLNEALCGLYAAGVIPFAKEEPKQTAVEAPTASVAAAQPIPAVVSDGRLPLTGSVVVSGAGIGLPGKSHPVFNDDNVQRLLNGENMIDPLTDDARESMLEKRITRLNKSEAGATMDIITDLDRTVKLAGQRGAFDLAAEFGIPADRVEATDIATQLAIAAGIEALRDAGIPLVMRYRKTSKGTFLPDRWMLPEALADETGVVFGSAFPGLNRMAEESERFFDHQNLMKQIETLQQLQGIAAGSPEVARELDARLKEMQDRLAAMNYQFDRRFIFRVLNMGHSQFAEYIGARGPNTSVNAACATTTHAVALAEDWIRSGRARRVVVISGDDVTSGELLEWVGSGMLASGASTTEGNLRLAVLPFDRRRNGLIMGMGAAALVLESEDAVRERGMRGIAEMLASQIGNSAYHGTRLDISHVREVMDRVVSQAEQRYGIRREAIAPHTVFVSHETYTPARGGSASAEINALRYTFHESASQVVIANTKGFTGHAMGVGIEDVLAVKSLETGIVPPIANINDGTFEPDPDLGDLNLSHGGKYPVDFSLRLGAGFGSQIAMTLMRRIPGVGERVNRDIYNRWLSDVAGYDHAELELTQRTLRIHNTGAPVRPPLKSKWQFGQGPTMWSATPDQPATAVVVSAAAHSAPAPAATAPVAQPAAQPVAVQTTAVGSASDEEIKTKILALVSEKTGYPAEMLDLDLDLEADLGIDTVKQAELFASVRGLFGIPRREDLRLSDYNTLAKVIGFVKESTGSNAPAPEHQVAAPVLQTVAPALAQAAAVPAPASQAAVTDDDVKARVLALVSEKTGYPAEMLDLDLDLEADLGIDTVKQAELFAAVRESYSIPRREDLRLSDYNTLAKVIGFVTEAKGSVAAQAATPAPAPAPAAEPVVAKVETAVPAAAVEGTGSDEEIKARLLAIVSEKTGYPAEMLDLDLDLEADLGIDTVKQAELFAAVRESYGIPRREDLRLADYNTLNKVIGFVKEALAPKPEAAQPAEPEAAPAAEPVAEAQPQTEEQAPAALPRRVPVPVLRPRLEICKPTSVSFTAETRVIVAHDSSKTGESLARKLRARKVQVLSLRDLSPEAINRQAAEWSAEGKIDGVYFLPALDVEAPITDMDQNEWHAENARRVEALYHLMRALPGDPFLVSATRLGGLLGYLPGEVPAPLGGAVSGFTKAYGMEHPRTLVKVVDFTKTAGATTVAGRLFDETLSDPGVVEVGWEGEQRYTISLLEQAAPATEDSSLGKDTVYLVTGGNGGIAAPILLDIATHNGGVFYLTGRSPLPAADDADLAMLKNDRDGLKRELARRLSESGQKATPAKIETQLSALDRSAAAVELVQNLQKAGGRAQYVSCDVTDPAAVEGLFAQVAGAEGKLDVILHAAGVDHSKMLANKTPEEFHKVFATKADGFFNLVKAMGALPQPVKAFVSFSSVAGRFGNAGQTDYSAANDLLCKLTSALRFTHPHVRFLALDWSAWAEVGMASRGSLPVTMERAGIEMMHPRDAAPLVRRELVSCAQGEVVLAGALGMLSRARDKDGGLDIEQANRALTEGNPVHIMLSRAAGYDLYRGLVLEAELDPETEPFLKDHAMNGIPVLPGVMGIEGFSVAAKHVSSVLGASQAGFRVARLEDVRFLQPFKFYRNESRRITWHAQVVRQADGLVALVTLESTLVSKLHKDEIMQHFSGRVYLEPLSAKEAETMQVEPPHWNGNYTLDSETVYKLYFHGPAFQVLDGVQREGDTVIGRLNRNLPPTTSTEQPLLTTPLLIELCLQTAGVYEVGATGVMALPSAIGEVRLYSSEMNGEQLYAQVVPTLDEDKRLCFNARVVDETGKVFLELKDYRTSPLPFQVEEQLWTPLKKLVEGL